MAAVRFPESVGIGNMGGRAEIRNHEMKWVKKSDERGRGADVIDISPEAKRRFEKDNLIKFEKIKLMKEAGGYHKTLAAGINFNEADMRNVYRPDRISKVKLRLDNGFYDRFEAQLVEKILKNSIS